MKFKRWAFLFILPAVCHVTAVEKASISETDGYWWRCECREVPGKIFAWEDAPGKKVKIGDVLRRKQEYFFDDDGNIYLDQPRSNIGANLIGADVTDGVAVSSPTSKPNAY